MYPRPVPGPARAERRREQSPADRAVTGADEWSARSSWLIACLLFLSVVVLYWPVGRFGFVEIDDGLYVTEGLSAANIRWAFFNGEAYLWHP